LNTTKNTVVVFDEHIQPLPSTGGQKVRGRGGEEGRLEDHDQQCCLLLIPYLATSDCEITSQTSSILPKYNNHELKLS